MANSSHIPVTGLHEVRPESPSARTAGGLRAITPGHIAGQDNAQATNGNILGPRKLVRPTLPARAFRERGLGPRGESPLLAHHEAMTISPADESSHAEAFYFQKQIQTQTLMAFVLEDGEQIEGYIEWYDRNVIKVRNGSRTLIYKSSIKYLHKVGEACGQ
jgi:sRNA-binding regulator protein Hfq